MRFLALTTRPLQSRGSGYDLRVANLCAYLPGEVHHVVAPFQPVGAARAGLPLDGVFASSEELAPLTGERPGRLRHLRTTNRRFLALTRPAAFAAARERVEAVVRERDITHVVVFGGEIAEVATGLTGVVRVLDVCDSTSLTTRRERPAGRGPRARVRRLAAVVDEVRKRRTESRFPADFDLVTAISEPDARAVESGRHPRGTVRVVPNGLDEAYVRPLPAEPGGRRGVVFWGNLAFGPNRSALRFFLDHVHDPHLRERGVEVCVIGAGAPPWLTARAAADPSVVLPGFVDDLPATVARYPIMINPMRTGSGLKNKVLEAFGLGIVVVSSPLGVEALHDAEDDRHLVLAGTGEEHAAAVLDLLDDPPRRARLRRAAHALVHGNHLWSAVGGRWRELCRAAGGRRPARPRDAPHSIV